MSTDNELVISRTFRAPQALVFKAFSEAEALAKWWGPKGFGIHVEKLDFRPGGIFHYYMTAPNGNRMWGRFMYQEIKAPERIVFVNSFSDENGGITANPWMPDWPLEVLNVLTLAEQGGETTLTLRGGPINASPRQHELFLANRPSMQAGFKGTFEQLDAYLEELQRA